PSTLPPVPYTTLFRSVLELRDAAARELHRARDVEEHRQVRVRVGLVLLDVVAIRTRVQPPVDAADVVAGDVAAMLREVDRRAEVDRKSTRLNSSHVSI